MYDNFEDLLLAKRFAEGDNEAFQAIFLRYYKPLLWFGLKKGYANNWDEGIIEDMVMNIFIKLHRNRSKYISICQIRCTLYVGLNRLLIDRHRFLVKGRKTGETYHDRIDTVKDEIEDTPVFSREMIYEILYQKLNKLAKRRRQIIKDLFFLNLTNREICEKYNIDDQTVRNTKAKSLQILRELMTPYKHLLSI